MLLGKKAVAICEGIAKEWDNYHSLNTLCIEKEEISASNGHSLYWVENDEVELDYPERKDYQDIQEFPAFIPVDVLKRIIPSIPKGNLDCIKKINVEKNKVSTNNLDFETTIEYRDISDVSFPDMDPIKKYYEKPQKDPVVEFNLSVTELEVLLKIAKKVKSSGLDIIKFKASGQNHPVSVEIDVNEPGEFIKGMIMPCQS